MDRPSRQQAHNSLSFECRNCIEICNHARKPGLHCDSPRGRMEPRQMTVSLVKDNITLTLSREQWMQIRGALLYTARKDRQEDRYVMSYTLNQIRNQIARNM